jgi:hypothetical protein
LMQFANQKPPGTTLHEETHVTRKPAFVRLFLKHISKKSHTAGSMSLS